MRLLSACRSAVVPRGGAFAGLEAHALAAPVIVAALARAGIAPQDVDELIVSNAIGPGGNLGRVCALAAGLPQEVAGLSLDRQCAGGLDALLIGAQMIASGAARVVVAGGVESYSRQPIRQRSFADGRPPERYVQSPFTPWPDRDPDMAAAAAALAQREGISRAAQEDWAIQSHQKARSAPVVPAEWVQIESVAHDPFARDLTPGLCRRAKVLAGDITTATTAVAADGAAFCVLVADDVAPKGGGVRLLGGATLGGDPLCPGLAPVAAIERALAGVGLAPRDLAVAEIMEAFAVQAIACVQRAGIAEDIVNPGGGALARGHPIGASGTINAVRLFHGLAATGGTGLAAIAAAGGIGTALVLAA